VSGGASQAGPSRTGPSQAGPSRTGPSQAGPGGIGPVRTGDGVARGGSVEVGASGGGALAASRSGAEGARASRRILPGATIGVLGGGQLGRMLVHAGSRMGYRFAALDPDPRAPCGQVADLIVARYDDLDAARELARRADVITYEFENVDADVAAVLETESFVPQGSALLRTTQNRLREKRAGEAAGARVAPYAEIASLDGLREAVERLGLPAVLKTAEGGYDGKGQRVLRRREDLAPAWEELSRGGRVLMLEKFIDFEREISVIAARRPSGEVRAFPPAENVHVDNILHLSIVPARIPDSLKAEAERLAVSVAESLGVAGLIAVEMFVGRDGALYVNELAPRPHNSGHYTIEACRTSQFEQHIRAICDLPLGDTALLTPAVMVNVLGQHLPAVLEWMQRPDEAAERLGVAPKVHLYGKAEARPGRKMGHVNVLAENVDAALEWIAQTNIWKG